MQSDEFGHSNIPGVPDVDHLQIDDEGNIYLHMDQEMTPEQLQLIVDYAKKIRKEKQNG